MMLVTIGDYIDTFKTAKKWHLNVFFFAKKRNLFGFLIISIS
jgi:hypothetical protein